MSSNDEMYSILTPCLSLTPTPAPFWGGFFFPFFSLRASYLSKVLSAISSLSFSICRPDSDRSLYPG